GADHHDVAMGKVDQSDDAVHHRVAQRDQRIDAAQRQAVNELLNEDVHKARARQVLTLRETPHGAYAMPRRAHSRTAPRARIPPARSIGLAYHGLDHLPLAVLDLIDGDRDFLQVALGVI